MKFIAKHIQAIGLLMLAGFVAAAAALYFDLPTRAAGRSAVAPAAVAAESHAGCNHAQASALSDSASAPAGCDHSGGGCCSLKAKAPVPSAGGCTRDLAGGSTP